MISFRKIYDPVSPKWLSNPAKSIETSLVDGTGLNGDIEHSTLSLRVHTALQGGIIRLPLPHEMAPYGSPGVVLNMDGMELERHAVSLNAPHLILIRLERAFLYCIRWDIHFSSKNTKRLEWIIMLLVSHAQQGGLGDMGPGAGANWQQERESTRLALTEQDN